jgi:hypothetical protein
VCFLFVSCQCLILCCCCRCLVGDQTLPQ